MLAKAPDEELLSRLLGRPIARTNRLGDLLDRDPAVIAALGFTEREAEVLQVVAEIARRYQPLGRDLALDPEDVLPALSSLRSVPHVRMVALVGDRDGRYSGPVALGEGFSDCRAMDPFEMEGLLRTARGAAVILAHNHIAGSVVPTESDLRLTQRAAELCRVHGVDFVDHIIVGARDWISLRRAHVLDRCAEVQKADPGYW